MDRYLIIHGSFIKKHRTSLYETNKESSSQKGDTQHICTHTHICVCACARACVQSIIVYQIVHHFMRFYIVKWHDCKWWLHRYKEISWQLSRRSEENFENP